MQTPLRNDHMVYRRRARREVGGNARVNIGCSEPWVPVTPAEPKPVVVYTRRRPEVRTGLRADLADSAVMNILDERRGPNSSGGDILKVSVASDEVLCGSEIDGRKEAEEVDGTANLLDAFRAEEAALNGERGPSSTGMEILEISLASDEALHASELHGWKEAEEGDGFANLLDAFRAEAAALTGERGPSSRLGKILNISLASDEALRGSKLDGQKEVEEESGSVNLLDAFSAEEATLSGISFTQLLSSPTAVNLESFGLERGPAVDIGDQNNREECLGIEDATCSTILGSDEVLHSRPMDCTSRMDTFAPSASLHSRNVHRKIGIDLNRTPRQKLRKKKHPTPKIAIEGKPMRTPKTKTRTKSPSTRKRKYVRKNAVEGLSTPSIEEPPRKSVRRTGLVDTPITPFEDAVKGHPHPSSGSFHASFGLGEKSCKRCLNFDEESHLQEMKVTLSAPPLNEFPKVDMKVDLNSPPQELVTQAEVRRRVNRRSQCLIKSRKIEPNFPNKCKRRRTERQRKAVLGLLRCFPKSFKKRRSSRWRRANISGLWSFISEIVQKKQRKLTARISSKRRLEDKAVNEEVRQTVPEVRETKERLSDAAEEGCLDCTNVPASSLMLKTPLKKAPKGEVKTLPKKEVDYVEEGYLGCTNVPGCSLMLQNLKQAPKAKVKKLLKKELDFMIQRLMRLDIKDEVGALVLYKPKQKTPKVLLDMETMRVWNQLMMLEGADGDGNGETHSQREETWEEERNKFREVVENLTAHMHMILGDRRFTPWKGSVVDSVVGVFLTQNVSDYLSSSAFMSLQAKFPLKSENKDKEDTKVDECSEQTAGSVGSTYHVTEPSDQEDRYSGVTEESIYVQDMTGSNNLSDESPSPPKETQLEREDSSSYFSTICLSQESCSNLEFVIEKSDSQNVQADTREFDQETDQRDPVLEGASEEKHVQVEMETPTPRGKKNGVSQKESKKLDPAEWERLRRMYSTDGPRNKYHMDSVDWEAVRCAKLEEVAETIKERGQHYIIASRIQEFLTRLISLHNSIDLEWLRDCPPDKVKDYLLEVNGLGLKSVECVRLLCLHHLAFPVDTNVGRIAVRLGWVPLQPLPNNIQLHLLETYPIMDEIQKYLWPRLCTLDQRTLYELHYHLITFGKVFCTKRSPNCNACPLRGDCKHFASAFASSFSLPAPQDESIVVSVVPLSSDQTSFNHSVPLINEAPSSVQSNNVASNWEPIIEEPATPERETCNSPLRDIEDLCLDIDGDNDEIPTIKLNSSQFVANLCSFMNESIQENSKALGALTSAAASIPLPKLKYVSRLRTEHQVYELPDYHPLVRSFERREPDDPCPYLLAIWPRDSSQLSEARCKSQISGEICNEERCPACEDHNSGTIKGTILIPCRTAMRGSFPLNGTYFQVNEVFADHESTRNPIDVPRDLIWNLRRRTAYFGTSTTTILRGLSTEKIQLCFWRGFVCVRGFDRKTRASRPLSIRFHRATSVSKAAKGEAVEE